MKELRKIIVVISAVIIIFSAISFFSIEKGYVKKIGKQFYKQYKMVSIDDCKLAVRDYGKGKPIIIIESGLACTKDMYLTLQYDLLKKYRVISYDHAGIGDSTPSEHPRTLPYYVGELRQMLRKEHAEPPYILIGHSLGGHIIRYYAYLYPDEVLGLVFIDHPHEDWFEYIRDNWTKDENEEYFKFWTKDNLYYKGTAQQELLSYEENCNMIKGIKIPLNTPALMFTGYNFPHFRKNDIEKEREDMNAWVKMQFSIIKDLAKKKQIVDWDAGHYFHNDKPELVYTEISKFVDGIITHK